MITSLCLNADKSLLRGDEVAEQKGFEGSEKLNFPLENSIFRSLYNPQPSPRSGRGKIATYLIYSVLIGSRFMLASQSPKGVISIPMSSILLLEDFSMGFNTNKFWTYSKCIVH